MTNHKWRTWHDGTQATRQWPEHVVEAVVRSLLCCQRALGIDVSRRKSGVQIQTRTWHDRDETFGPAAQRQK